MIIEYKNKYIIIINNKTIFTLNNNFKNLNYILRYFKTKKYE